MLARIPVTAVEPVVGGGAYPAKAVPGESFPVRARVFREGRGHIGVAAVLTGPDGLDRPPVAMSHIGNDAYQAWVEVTTTGAWSFRIESWADPYATWVDDAQVKIGADVDVDLMLAEGAALLDRARGVVSKVDVDTVAEAVTALRDDALPAGQRLEAATSAPVRRALDRTPIRDHHGVSGSYPLYADRERALVGAWYELFPRSEGAVREPDGTIRSGTLRTAAERLGAIAAMGFDVVYLPPIHPIGEVNRKGPNNSLAAGPGDPGSPWAIGSVHGGHDAVHPELGTLEDFDAFVAQAHANGLEVALDLALQCAPDHPWVSAHPEWFTTRADGSIAYAENPPKKYQDIYPLDFDADPDGLYAEVRRVIDFWISHGVRIFRVDNPHTKPFPFWERLLSQLRQDAPDVVMLSEAFTRPALLQSLAMIGFHQSYTYFTWRNTKSELEEYLTELSTETAHVVRPNLFVNTPDILTSYLQHGGAAAFKVRATVAATASPSWGMYAGFELYENTPLRPGSEEYLDSEKYQIRVRDWDSPAATTLAPYVTRLNDLRRRHPALRRLRNLTVHRTDDEAILCYSKRTGDDTVIVVVNVDPHRARETIVHLTMPELGLDWDATFTAYDELSGRSWSWSEHNYVRLDPHDAPAHVVVVSDGDPGREGDR
ncbi:alpha-1,4-glucan--maltose-1-phosphate maltosyltransferase [Nocardioidaceae bacterium SCSIO 66511]|nr:alpha-1,4-glucan--maltose-1-phosphate maltosyltransferase [Nocardioidaceae bacterium SCSIO 66511]